ncbi:MAG: TolC family protein [Candidatus Omnitrophota bacterium]|nr:TolC family protein [Candidatus Omnitrophota bacterium]
MLKKVFIILFAGILTLNSLVFLAAGEPLSLPALIDEARKGNPEILAAKKRWEASLARVPQAKSFDDSIVGAGFQYTPGSPFQLSKTPSMERMLSFSQFLPFFGKLSLKGKIAVVESQMFASEYKNKELEIINGVKNAYYGLFINQKEIELNQQSFELLRGLAKVAEAKYAVGDISQEEVYKIHLELARLNNTLENLGQEKLSRQTRLNALLNKGPESPLGVPGLGEDTAFTADDIRQLYQETILNQPELAIFSYAIERNKYAKSLAKRSFFPDLMAGIAQRGITTGTIGPWDLLLSFTLPIWFWTKQRYQVKEAIANLEEAEAAYKAMQNRAFAEVKDLVTKIEIAKNKIQLYKTSLIPIIEGSIDSSLAAFRSGKGDFMMFLDSQRMLIENKMDYYKALVEYNISLADLERVVGVELK